MVQHCWQCRKRLVMVEKRGPLLGQPPTHKYRYYVCPRCNSLWSLDVERNFVVEGLPEDVLERAIRRGILTKDGRLNR